MPNWVKNRVTVKGEFGDFLERCKKAAESGLFNEFVPMPKCYDFDTTNYTTDPKNTRKNLLTVGATLGYGLGQFVVDEEYIEQFKKAEEEQKELGTIGWYDWNINNWGTKWDANDLYVDDDPSGYDCLEFSTAWSYPDEFFSRLSKQYPNARFYVFYADEDIGNNCGGVIWENGESKDIEPSVLYAEMLWSGNEGLQSYVDFEEGWR